MLIKLGHSRAGPRPRSMSTREMNDDESHYAAAADSVILEIDDGVPAGITLGARPMGRG